MARKPKPFERKVERTLKSVGLAFEIEIEEYLLEKWPRDIDVMARLAELYTRSGNYENGLELDLKLAEIDPNNPVIHYNLACSYSLLNRVDASLSELEIAINLGYSDAEHMNNDSDLENVKSSPRFRSLLGSIKS